MIDKSQMVLLELIKASLFKTTPIIPEDTEWGKVYREAEAQTVSGIVAAAVPQDIVTQWESVTSRCVAAFLRVLHGQAQLLQLLNQADITAVILKGIAAAIYYPAPYRRMMGDVDFLVPQEKFEQAARLMETNGYMPFHNLRVQIDASVCPRHIEFAKEGIEYELHHHFSGNGIDVDTVGVSRNYRT